MKLTPETLKRLAFGAAAAIIGFALAQTDVSLPETIKAALVAALAWLGANKP
jgi:hypothetical protein